MKKVLVISEPYSKTSQAIEKLQEKSTNYNIVAKISLFNAIKELAESENSAYITNQITRAKEEFAFEEIVILSKNKLSKDLKKLIEENLLINFANTTIRFIAI